MRHTERKHIISYNEYLHACEIYKKGWKRASSFNKNPTCFPAEVVQLLLQTVQLCAEVVQLFRAHAYFPYLFSMETAAEYMLA